MKPARSGSAPRRTTALRRFTLAFAAVCAFSGFARETREKDDIVFSADTMSGNAGKKNASAVLNGNARVTIGGLSIESDSMEISGEDYRFVTADGGVSGEDVEKGFSFTAKSMDYDREKETSVFRGPLSFHDTENGVEISAGMLSYDRNTETIFIQIDVVLKKDDMVCSSAFALYRRDQSLLELSGMPSVINDDNEFHADRIYVNLDTEHITLDGAVSGNIKDTPPEDAEDAAETDGSGREDTAAEN